MSPILNWRKSSYSGEEGNCVEVGWRKSSYSASQSDCVEVGAGVDLVGVRDTKDRDGGTLAFPPQAWGSFLHRLKADQLR
ncbi:DUF397 domain-containing protein [Saccharopolyspora hirsuta]|uniref:DUF397 domain-containing protein n=1 Tax=Saccharopolyspora hirsuta TaxID=1837 RepID=UPI00332EA6DC